MVEVSQFEGDVFVGRLSAIAIGVKRQAEHRFVVATPIKNAHIVVDEPWNDVIFDFEIAVRIVDVW